MTEDEKQDANNNELARARTDWAEDRTILANERTFAGWMRTGLASVGIGLGFEAIFGKFDPTWLAKLISSSFVAIGIFIILAARHNARKLLERINAHDVQAQPPHNMTLIALIMSVGAFALLVSFWTLDWTG